MINNIILVGRITKDPEIKELPDGRSVCEISLAVARPFKNATTHEIDTDFITCTLWEVLALNVCEYCKKGYVVGVKGRIQTRSYDVDGVDGEKHRISYPEVIAERVFFISNKASNINAAVEGE